MLYDIIALVLDGCLYTEARAEQLGITDQCSPFTEEDALDLDEPMTVEDVDGELVTTDDL